MVSETRYFRSDTWTVNGLSAYQLGTSNTANQTSITAVGQGSLGVTLTITVYVLHSSGGQDQIASFNVTRSSGSGALLYTGTVNISQTSLAGTDAIMVKAVVTVGSDSETAYFVTEQLGAAQLDAATWTFYLYISRYYDKIEGVTTGSFIWGNSSFQSRIINFCWSTVSAARHVVGDGLVCIVA